MVLCVPETIQWSHRGTQRGTLISSQMVKTSVLERKLLLHEPKYTIKSAAHPSPPPARVAFTDCHRDSAHCVSESGGPEPQGAPGSMRSPVSQLRDCVRPGFPPALQPEWQSECRCGFKGRPSPATPRRGEVGGKCPASPQNRARFRKWLISGKNPLMPNKYIIVISKRVSF